MANVFQRGLAVTRLDQYWRCQVSGAWLKVLLRSRPMREPADCAE